MLWSEAEKEHIGVKRFPHEKKRYRKGNKMKMIELIPDYDSVMTRKFQSKLDTFRKIKNLQKKLYDEYPNQCRVAEWRISDEMVEEKNILQKLKDWNVWEQTDAKDEKDIITCVGGKHTKSIYRSIESGTCVLVDEVMSVGDHKPKYKIFILYIQRVE